MNILQKLLCIWSDWKSLNGLNFLKDINIKFRKTELVEILQLLRVWIHSSLSMQECRDESEIYNFQHIQVSNNKFINGILGGGGGVRLIWLDCIALFQFLHKIIHWVPWISQVQSMSLPRLILEHSTAETSHLWTVLLVPKFENIISLLYNMPGHLCNADTWLWLFGICIKKISLSTL